MIHNLFHPNLTFNLFTPSLPLFVFRAFSHSTVFVALHGQRYEGTPIHVMYLWKIVLTLLNQNVKWCAAALVQHLSALYRHDSNISEQSDSTAQRVESNLMKPQSSAFIWSVFIPAIAVAGVGWRLNPKLYWGDMFLTVSLGDGAGVIFFSPGWWRHGLPNSW